MSMKLYFGPGACSFVPHTLLETAGAEFEPVMVKLHKGEQQQEAFKAVNPRGQVPVLVDGDTVITQILAIVQYLDARFPEQRFLPAEPLARAKVLETLAWMNNTVHPTFTHVFMPFKFAESAEAQAELKAFNAKAYARLEVMKMERGVSYLDTIYTGAPLIGLIGTVSGLLATFSVIDPETHMPDPVQFTESVGYALAATLLGLCIAVVALVGNGYLHRRIEHHAARLDVLLERILARAPRPDKELVQ